MLVDRKATDVALLDVRGMSSYADYFVLASGDSERQVTASAEHVREQLKSAGNRTIGTEGFDTGNWVLLDYGEVVVHVFFTEVRAFYDLDGLWADAPKEKVA
jgi:ribosome-associated protein